MHVVHRLHAIRFLVPISASLLALTVLQSVAAGQTITWCLNLDGPQAGTNSPATGVGTASLDTQTNIFSWNISHQGLTGTHIASHFHGPALPGQDAGVQVNIGVGNPLVGSSPITAQQANDLMAGLWYANLHTTAHTPGEIRAQADCECFSVQCTALANSFDPTGARLTTEGDIVAGHNSISFDATGVPPSQFGYLLMGMGNGTFVPPGSSGQICLGGQPIQRFNSQIFSANAGGEMGPFTPDILNLGNPLGGGVMAGQSWAFQTWFRDGATSNFTDAIVVDFK